MNGCSFQQVLRQSFTANSIENGTWDFQNSPLFERSAYFYVKITGYFELLTLR